MDSELPRHSVSVTGIITDDHGRALLIQRRDNHHCRPPGGVLELGESIEEGLRREVREETGLDIEPTGLTGIYKNMSRGIIALVFHCRSNGGQPTTSNETEALRWASETEIRMLVEEAYAVRILDALNGHSAAIRQHDGRRLT